MHIQGADDKSMDIAFAQYNKGLSKSCIEHHIKTIDKYLSDNETQPFSFTSPGDSSWH